MIEVTGISPPLTMIERLIYYDEQSTTYLAARPNSRFGPF